MTRVLSGPKTRIGDRHGRLEVIAHADRQGRGRKGRFVCRCDCGDELEVLGSHLRNGSVKSCGCLRREVLAASPPAKTAPGDRHGRLTVIEEAGRKRRQRTYLCRCDCGAEVVVGGTSLRRGTTRSCGCLAREVAAASRPNWRHGHAGETPTPTYVSWESMIARCTNPRRHQYPRYGGRGITVCDRWRTFENFLADMGERPAGTTVDRIDPDGNYEPGNCRWATDDVQTRDKGRSLAGPGLCRKGLHDITTQGSTFQDSDGFTRCRECRLESKRAHRRRAA